MATLPKASDFRKADHPIDLIFVNRWSPRAMTGETITHEELMTLFEAARWAPSSYNEQPWRFLYAMRGDPDWPTFFNLLVPANQEWARHAAVLLLIAARTTFTRNNKPNPVHSFDSGSAWCCLALQGSKMNLVVHGMAGFDWDRAPQALNIPDGFAVQAMAAIGRPGDPDLLPESLRKVETPSGRKPVSEIAIHGLFPR